MYAVVETKENELTVGTECRVPDEFTYMIFIIGLCNLKEGQTELISILSNDMIGKAIHKTPEELAPKIEALTKRGKDINSIYDWYTYMKNSPDGKKISCQIVTDAVYKDEKLILRYNYSLREEILILNKYYKNHGDEIIARL